MKIHWAYLQQLAVNQVRYCTQSPRGQIRRAEARIRSEYVFLAIVDILSENLSFARGGVIFEKITKTLNLVITISPISNKTETNKKNADEFTS